MSDHGQPPDNSGALQTQMEAVQDAAIELATKVEHLCLGKPVAAVTWMLGQIVGTILHGHSEEEIASVWGAINSSINARCQMLSETGSTPRPEKLN